MRIKLTGSKQALKDPRVLWEINRQLLRQEGQRERTVSAGHIQGSIILNRGDKVGEAIELIKARVSEPSFQGELDVITELTETMSALHRRRLERLNDDLSRALGLEDELLKASRYPREWFKPPQAVAEEAARGLKLRRKYNRGGLTTKEAGKQGIGSGVQRAVDLRDRENMSPETIKRMIAFFARHRQHKDNKTPSGEPAAGMIAWLLWGGDAGERWALKVREKMERLDATR